jgi:hypothetical protein
VAIAPSGRAVSGQDNADCSLHYRSNFVFGLASWDNVCTKASGEWLFKSMRTVKWMGDTVPWVGEDRVRTNAPAGAII